MKKINRLIKSAWSNDWKLFLAVIGQSLLEALIPMADIVGIGAVIDALMTGQDRKRVSAVILYYVLVHTGISLARELFAWLKNLSARKATNAVQRRYARQSLEVDFPYIQTGERVRRISCKDSDFFAVAILPPNVYPVIKET